MVDIASFHREEYQSEPHVVASAPGKVNLMGEQTEFADGLLLSLAINRRVWVALEERDDNYLRFFSADLQERKKSSLTNLKYKREDRWSNFLKAVVFTFQQKGYTLRGLNITVYGEIPQSLGMASSSAMELALALTIRQKFSLDLSDMQLVEVVRLAEFQFMKIDSGISSPLVSMMGKQGQFLYLDSRNLDYKYINYELPGYTLLLVNTKVPNRVNDGDKIDFRQEFNRCLAKLKENHIKPVLRELTHSDISSTVEFLSESQRRYCLHVLEEDHRVIDLPNQLKHKDMSRIGKAMFRSHESMRDQMEISCPELDWIVKRIQENSDLDGARMIGPGFGGCIIALIHDSNRESFREILDEYDRIFGFKAEFYECLPSEGAGLEN